MFIVNQKLGVKASTFFFSIFLEYTKFYQEVQEKSRQRILYPYGILVDLSSLVYARKG